MSYFSLRVANMSCSGCASSVENNLREIRGVNSVTVNLIKQEVIVAHDGTTDEEEVLLALDKMGYPKLGDESLFKQAKSYVSCLTGRLK